MKKGNVVRKTVLTIGLLSFAALMLAQTPKLSVSVSTDTILLGNHFELKFTIENATAMGFEAPDLHKFNVISGPNTSTSISIINGEMSQSASYTYYLEPTEIGVYTIKPAYLTAGDEAFETPPIDIIVVPNPEGIIQRPHAAEKRFDHLSPPKFNEDGSLPPSKEQEEPSRPRKKF